MAPEALIESFDRASSRMVALAENGAINFYLLLEYRRGLFYCKETPRVNTYTTRIVMAADHKLALVLLFYMLPQGEGCGLNRYDQTPNNKTYEVF